MNIKYLSNATSLVRPRASARMRALCVLYACFMRALCALYACFMRLLICVLNACFMHVFYASAHMPALSVLIRPRASAHLHICFMRASSRQEAP